MGSWLDSTPDTLGRALQAVVKTEMAKAKPNGGTLPKSRWFGACPESKEDNGG